MKLEGYKISGYDATYRKTLFNVCERGDCVLEITEVNSGTTFLVDFSKYDDEPRRTRTWRKRESRQEEHGKSVHFGSKGFFEQLKYGNK